MRPRRRRGLPFDAVFFVLGLALFAAGLIDLFSGEVTFGLVEMAAAGAIGWLSGTSLRRRFQAVEPGMTEALGAAAIFTAFGILGLLGTFSGDAVRVAFGAIAAALLLPLAALIVLRALRGRAAGRGEGAG
jgi:hypothetical protein